MSRNYGLEARKVEAERACREGAQMQIREPNEPGKLATASFLVLMVLLVWMWVGAIWMLVMLRG